MTGTREKIIKLNLEGDSAGDKFPPLKENVAEAAMKLFDETRHEGEGLFYDLSHDLNYYTRVLGATKNLNVRQEQLNAIIAGLENYSESENWSAKAGLFLTALIQNSKQKEFEIKMERGPAFLGFMLGRGKTITLKGDAGGRTGMSLAGGTLNIEGDVGMYTGQLMDAGVINVTGNAGNYTGVGMRNGTIKIGGDVGENTGKGMIGGHIHIKGNAGRGLGDKMKGGGITVNGEMADLAASVGGMKDEGPKPEGGQIWNKRVKIWGK
ncbi:MAG: hypothetical protein V1921_06445 [Candidatus Altiarchaeota archaeon]